MRILAAVAIVVLLTGCAPVDLDPIMGRTTGTPTTETQTLHCDLIFPPVSVNP